jgi:4'-phosphopantetheinyl transferase
MPANFLMVHYADLDQLAQTPDRVERPLNDEERQRSARILSKKIAARYAASRYFLRTVLGDILQISPAEVDFTYGVNGKPSLGGRYGNRGLKFNMSHSAGLAALAVCDRAEVGIDVEELRPISNCLNMARDWLSLQDFESLSRCSESDRSALFLSCWTRNEALLKAKGGALSGRKSVDEDGLDVRVLAPPTGWIGIVASQQPMPAVIEAKNWWTPRQYN